MGSTHRRPSIPLSVQVPRLRDTPRSARANSNGQGGVDHGLGGGGGGGGGAHQRCTSGGSKKYSGTWAKRGTKQDHG